MNCYSEEEIMNILNTIDDLINNEMGINNEYDDNALVDDMSYRLNDLGYTVCYGISKVVILDDYHDEVIKIPFNGIYSYNEEEEIDIFHQNYGANTYQESGSEWDYCETEVLNYALAAEKGYEEFFLETQLLGEYNGHPIYRQKKGITMSNNESIHASAESAKLYRDSRSLHNEAGMEWTAIAVDQYGKEKIEDFLNFLAETGMDEDLHADNVGFNTEGKCVLIDYSGWRE